MKHLTRQLTLTAALLLMGCGSDEAYTYLGLGSPGQADPGTPPAAVADIFSLLGNASLSGSVITNDTVNGATVTSFQNPTTLGGTVTVSANGDFIYTAPLNRSNVSDTFTYTLRNEAGSSSATVTLQLGARGLFVKNDVASSGNGSQATPFKTLAEAVTAANGVDGAQIVVFRGDGTNTGLSGAVPLGTNQGISSFDPSSPANITGPIDLSRGNTVRNLRIAASLTSAVTGTSGANATLSGLEIEASANNGVSLTDFEGTFSVTNSTFRDIPNNGVLATNNSGTLVWSVTDSTFTNVIGRGISSAAFGTSSQNVTVNRVTSQGGTDQFVSATPSGSANVGLNVTNLRVDGGGTRVRGLGIISGGTSNILVLLSASNITNCRMQGMQLFPTANSNIKSRITGNLLSGNAAGISFDCFASGSTSAGLIFENNIGENYNFTQFPPAIIEVESFDQFNAASNNTGTVNTSGTVGNAPAGSLNIP